MTKLYESVEQVTSTQNWLKVFIQGSGDAIIKRELGLCTNAVNGADSWLVNTISRVVDSEGFVINDPLSQLTAEWQYRRLPLYEGMQLELRKEFAQLCIDYLEESIRI